MTLSNCLVLLYLGKGLENQIQAIVDCKVRMNRTELPVYYLVKGLEN